MIAYAKPVWLFVEIGMTHGKSELMREAIRFTVIGPMPDPPPLSIGNVIRLLQHEAYARKAKESKNARK